MKGRGRVRAFARGPSNAMSNMVLDASLEAGPRLDGRDLLLRAGVGVLRRLHPWLVGGALVAEREAAAAGAAAGLRLEGIHLPSGGWLSAEVRVTRRLLPELVPAVGWSVFGVELQLRRTPHLDPTWFVRVRLPLGALAWAWIER